MLDVLLYQPINPVNQERLSIIEFKNVISVRGLSDTLISVLDLTKNGEVKVLIEKQTMSFLDPSTDKLLYSALVQGKLPRLNGYIIDPENLYSVNLAYTPKISKDLLHRRMSHAGSNRIEQLINLKLVHGINIDETSTYLEHCPPCIAGKLTKFPFPKQSLSKINERGDLIVSDLKSLPIRSKEVITMW